MLEERVLLVSPQFASLASNGGAFINPNGSTILNEPPRELTIKFSPGQQLDPNTVGNVVGNAFTARGITLTSAGPDKILGNADDTPVAPGYIALGDEANTVLFRFASTPTDNFYRLTITGAGANGLKNVGGEAFVNGASATQTIDFRLNLGPQVVAVVPEPVVRSGGTLTQNTNQIEVYFNQDDPLSNATATNPAFYQLIFTNDTVQNTDDVLRNPTTVTYDATTGKATLTFSSGLDQLPGAGPGTYRLRIGTTENVINVTPAQPPVLADPGSSFATATDLNSSFAFQFGLDGSGRAKSILLSSEIKNSTSSDPAYTLTFPGLGTGNGTLPNSNEPGDRDIPVEFHNNGGADGTSGIATSTFYNFQSVIGSYQGTTLFNQITEAQKQRAREIFELYGRYLGIKFTETANRGILVATGDLRSINPNIPSTSGIAGLAGAGKAVMNSDLQWDGEYGGSWFGVAIHEIGHNINMGHTFELPQTVMGGGGAMPQWPGPYDIIHGQEMFRPDSKDIDLYKFDIAAGSSGVFTAETIAQRQTDSSQLDSYLRLYRVNPTTGLPELIASNDNYFGNDSLVDLELTGGTYYIGVSASGNDSYDPSIPDSGLGGKTEGKYDLRMNFRPAASTTIQDTTGTALDGDLNGIPGGVYNYWFRVQTALNTKFVDRTSASATQDGSLANPYKTISAALAAATPGQIVRIVGNGGADNNLSTLGDNLAYQIGVDVATGLPLRDGSTLAVPKGVTVMVDAGTIFQLRNAIIDVGSSSSAIDLSQSAFQVLGTPTNSVYFTSWEDSTIGLDENPGTLAPGPSQWGGIVFRNDNDRNSGRFDYEQRGIFLDYVNHAVIQYGGGTVTSDPTAPSPRVSPIHLISARPTLTFNTFTFNGDAAISADPNSFEETNFVAPPSQLSATFTPDYGRVGPDIRGNRLINNSVNGLAVRSDTVPVTQPGSPGGQTKQLTVAGRFDDTDIVYVIQDNLIVTGQPSGPYEEVKTEAPPVTLVTLNASGGGTLLAGTYNYRVVFVDAQGNEGIPSDPTANVVVAANGKVDLANLPTPTPGGLYVARRLYRLDPASFGNPYALVAQLDSLTTTFTDTGATAGGLLVIPATTTRDRPRLSGGLTIDPNVIVKVTGSRIELGMGARLTAEGADGRPIIFSSTSDDRYGAGGTYDTNFDNAQSTGQPGQWSGIYVAPNSKLNLDYARLSYAGGISKVQGGFAGFNAVEIHQGDARITHSRFENDGIDINKNGLGGVGGPGTIGGTRVGHETNGLGIIYVQYSQPIIVGNTFVDTYDHSNAANHPNSTGVPVLNVDVNSLNQDLVYDRGRATYRGLNGIIDPTSINDRYRKYAAVSAYHDNHGPLVRENLLDTIGINGMQVRGGTVTVQSVWDDTDIVHVVTSNVNVDNTHIYGGVRLQSTPTQSLVVKLSGATAGFTINGSPLDIADRIGGIINVVGQPGFPVVLTSLADDSVGAGFDPTGLPQNDTNGDGLNTVKATAAKPAPGDWNSVRIDKFAHDRNVAEYVEREPAVSAPGTNATPTNAELLGSLAPNEASGDETRRLGYEVQGFLSAKNDIDVYSFKATTGTEVWLDVGRTTMALDAVLDLVDASGNIIASSDDSERERTTQTNAAFAAVSTTAANTQVSSTALPVAAAGTLQVGDTIRIGVNGAPIAITSIAGNNLTLALPATWNTNDAVTLVTRTSTALVVTSAAAFRVGDSIKIGATGSQVIVSAVDTTTNTLTLSAARTWASGDLVTLTPYTNSNPAVIPPNQVNGLRKSPTNSAINDAFTLNPRDPGMRVVLPGPANQENTYYLRVRSSPRSAVTDPQTLVTDPTQLSQGKTSGAYQLQIRIRETLEYPGSSVQFADIRYATNGVQVIGQPTHSQLTGEATEPVNATGTEVPNDTLANASGTPALQLGNLLNSDRAALSVAGTVVLKPGDTPQRVSDVDFYQVQVKYDGVEPFINGTSPLFVSTMFDIDYSDGLTRGDLTLSVFDTNGTLLYVGRDSNIADDRPRPTGNNDVADFSRGSVGTKDAFIGPVDLPEGTYYVAVSSNSQVPTSLDQFQNANANDRLKIVRVEPVTSVKRIAEDRITGSGGSNVPGSGTLPQLLPANTNAVPYNFGDVVLFVDSSGAPGAPSTSVFRTVDPFTGRVMTDLNLTNNNALQTSTGDIAMRTRTDVTNANVDLGSLFSFSTGIPGNLGGSTDGNRGNYLLIDPAAGTAASQGDDGIQTFGVDPASPTSANTTNVGIEFNGMTYSGYNPSSPNTLFAIGNRNPLNNASVPSVYAGAYASTGGAVRNVLYQFNATTGAAITQGGSLRTNNAQAFGGPGTDVIEIGQANTFGTITVSGVIEAADTFTITLTDAGGPQFITVTGQTTTNGVANALRAAWNAFGAAPFNNFTVNVNGSRITFTAINPTAALGTTIAVSTANGGSDATQLLTWDGNSGLGGNITGLAFVGGTLFGVSDVGDLYSISTVNARATFIAHIGDPGIALNFQGLSRGPANVNGGLYADKLIAITGNGDLWAFNTAGVLQPLFANGATSVSTGVANAVGLAFSPLDQNLWHITPANSMRNADAGHGLTVLPPDHSLDPTLASGQGGPSFYFGVNDDTTDGDTLGTYNFPGGAHGSLISNTFSLKGYSASDQPYLYFNYFLDTDSKDFTANTNQNHQTDSFRVFAAGDDGDWHLVATNDSYRASAGPADEYNSFNLTGYPLASSIPTVQELYDNTGAWRQARIPLAPFAGQERLRLRFDFSTAGSLNLGDATLSRMNTGGDELRAVDGDQLRDGDTFQVDATTYEFDTGYTLVVPSGERITAGASKFTVNGTQFTFVDSGAGGTNILALPTDSAETIAGRVTTALATIGVTTASAPLGKVNYRHDRLNLKLAVTASNDVALPPTFLQGAPGVTPGNIAITANADDSRNTVATAIRQKLYDNLASNRVATTTTTGAGVASTALVVTSTNNFRAGDTITIGAPGAIAPVVIASVNSPTSMTLAAPRTWANGDQVTTNTTAVGAGVNTTALTVVTSANYAVGDTITIGGGTAVVITAILGNNITLALQRSWANNAVVTRAVTTQPNAAFELNNDLIRVIGHTVSNRTGIVDTSEPTRASAALANTALLGLEKNLDGDTFGSFTDSGVSQPGLNNNHEGVFIDDLIIGFAERGEMVVNAPNNASTFTNNVDLLRASWLNPHNEVLNGPYQLEIRRGPEFANFASNTNGYSGPPDLELNKAYDTNDRLDQSVNLDAPRGSLLSDGQTFVLSDGVNSLTFEFEDLTTGVGNGVTPGNVAVNFKSTDPDFNVAVSIRDAINSAPAQNVFKGSILAQLGDGGQSFTRTDGVVLNPTPNRVNLFGNVVANRNGALLTNIANITVVPPLATNRYGDENRRREQGQILLYGNIIRDSSQFNVVVDASDRNVPAPAGATMSHPGGVRNLPQLNNERLIPGVVIENNVIARGTLGGVHFTGDSTGAGNQIAPVPFGRIVNNTFYGNLANNDDGVLIENHAAPTLLNNIFNNLVNAVHVQNNNPIFGAGVDPNTVVLGANYFQGNTNDVVGTSYGAFAYSDKAAVTASGGTQLPAGSPLFVNPATSNFYLAASTPTTVNRAIDSSVASLDDRFDFATRVKSAVGLAPSPIIAPEKDLFGLGRYDDPGVNSPAGLSFTDRGALERTDFAGPFARPVLIDDGGNERIFDTTVTEHQVDDIRFLRQFIVQLEDLGTGIDDTSTDDDGNPTNGSPRVQLYENNRLLVPNVDYVYVYNSNTNRMLLTALSVFDLDARYRIVVDPVGGKGIKDLAGNTFQGNQPDQSSVFNFLITNGVNDPPVNTVPVSTPTPLAAQEDTNFFFTAGNTISVTDQDAYLANLITTPAGVNVSTSPVVGIPDGVLRVTLTATNGVLTLAQTTGLTFVTAAGAPDPGNPNNDGTNDAVLRFTGTIANINSALNNGVTGLKFRGTQDYFGAATVTVLSEDLGNFFPPTNIPQSTTSTINLNLGPVNDAPTLDPIANVGVTQNSAATNVNLTGISIGPANEAPQVITITATSSNTAIVPDPTITYTSPNATGTLTFAPVTNQVGNVTITVTVKDNGGTANGGVDTTTQTFTITVGGVNSPPSFDPIGNQTVNEDSGNTNVTIANVSPGVAAFEATQTIAFTATSSNPLIVPNPTVTGSGTSRTLTFAPAANAFGTVTITVTAQDNGGTANGGNDTFSRTFTITVNPVNDPPTLTAIANLTINEDAALQTVNLSGITIGPNSGVTDESPQVIASVTATSSNTALIPNPTVTYTPSNPTGTLTFTPVGNANGTATITVTVTDSGPNGGANGDVNFITRTFTVTVNAVNDQPVFNAIGNVVVLEDPTPSPQTISITGVGPGGGPDEAGQTIAFTATSSNTAIIPNPTVTGSGATRTLSFAPVANANGGPVTITVTATDNGGTANGGVNALTRNFTITVTPVNDAPTLTALANVNINEDAGLQTVTLAGISAGPPDEAGQTLTVTVASDNTALIPTPVVNYTSPSAAGSLTFTPVANLNGTANITVTVTDNGPNGTPNGDVNFFVRTFQVTVGAVNDAPVFNPIGNVTVSEDPTPATQTISITGVGPGGGPDEAGQTVTFTATSSNPALIPTPTFTGSGSTRTLSYTPVANANGGPVTITVTATDNGGTANGGINTSTQTFTITVSAVNDPPVNSVPATQVTNDEDPVTFSAANGNAITISDVDAGNAVVLLSLVPTNGAITLATTSNLTSIAGDGSSGAGFVIQGTLTNLNAAINGLLFKPGVDFHGTATLAVTANDLGNTGSGGAQSTLSTINITVNDVNDPPVNSVPGPQTTAEDTPRIFSMGNGNAITVSDVDARGGVEAVTLTATNGTLTLGSIAGITVLAPSGGGNPTASTISFSGTLAAINNALNGLTFTPNLNFNGSASVTITTNDLGNSGSGGALSVTNSVAFTVTPVNDPPTVSTPSQDLGLALSGQPFTISYATLLATVQGSDVDGDTIQLRVDQVLSGTVTKNGTPVTPGSTSIGPNEALAWTPPANSSGPFAAFVLRAVDPSGATSANQATVTIDTATITRYLRSYNSRTDYHFFTTSQSEFQNAVTRLGYRDETTGQPGFAVATGPVASTHAIHRLYNPNNNRHYYTANTFERDFLVSLGYRYEKDEGYIFTTQVPGSTTIFRLYNNNSGTHLLTESASQMNAILAQFPGVWVRHADFGFAFPVSASGSPPIIALARGDSSLIEASTLESLTNSESPQVRVLATFTSPDQSLSTQSLSTSGVDRGLIQTSTPRVATATVAPRGALEDHSFETLKFPPSIVKTPDDADTLDSFWQQVGQQLELGMGLTDDLNAVLVGQ